MPQDAAPTIHIIKKVKGHGGHHGGAWKVAYADFVTAMMALFIVLWLMNSSEKVKKAISAYFQDPSGTGKQSGSAAAGTGDTMSVNKDNMENLKDMLEQAIKKSPELSKLKDYVQMSVTGEGLRIELLESEKGMFFESGSAKPSGLGEEMIVRLAQELAKLPNGLLIEGHTDAKPFSSKGDYSNWELSADRANAARRLIVGNGVKASQISQVRGFADQNLRDPAHPEVASNRRVSMIVRYQNTTQADEEPAEPAAGKAGEHATAKEGGHAEAKEPAKEPAKETSKEKEGGHH